MRLPRRTTAATAALLSAAAAVGAGCGSDPGVVGSVRVGGSTTLLSFVQQAAAAFTEQNPLARVRVDLTGTGDGFSLLCDGIAGAAAASRPETPREQRACAVSAVQSVPLLVGRDAIVVFAVRGSRAPACLSTRELRLLTGASNAPRATWDGIGPAGLPLVVVVPEPGSGTRDAFAAQVLRPPGSGDPVDLRADAVPAAQGQQMLARVLGSRGAIGITGFATAKEWGDKVRAIQVNDGDGCVAPTDATIASDAYPLTRDLLMYVRSNGQGADGAAAIAFGDVVASPGLLGRPGSGLSAADIAATGQAWRDRSGRDGAP